MGPLEFERFAGRVVLRLNGVMIEMEKLEAVLGSHLVQ